MTCNSAVYLPFCDRSTAGRGLIVTTDTFLVLPYLLSSSLHTSSFHVCETVQDIVPPFPHPFTLCLVLFCHCNLFLSRLYSFTLIFLPCHLFLRIFVKISVKFATFFLPSKVQFVLSEVMHAFHAQRCSLKNE